MEKQRGQRKLYQTQHLCSWEIFKKASRMSEALLSWSLKDITKGESILLHVSCTSFWSVNFQLNSKCNTCSANQPSPQNFKTSAHPARRFSLTPKSIFNPDPYFTFMEAFSPTRNTNIFATRYYGGQRCNSIMWLNQFKWLMYKELRMPSSFQLKANNCSIIS